MVSQTNIIKELKDFYSDKTVTVTGVHGFKGAWLALLLKELGAKVIGVGLPNQDERLLFNDALVEQKIEDVRVIDIRDRDAIIEAFKKDQADVVFHLAAQPIVSVGYDDPYLTYTSNVIGTLNIFEGVREINKRVSFVNITTDKVYKNFEKEEGYVETDELMGYDPYSSSKSCAELVAYSYTNSFFSSLPENVRKIVSNVRAGNVIGGGDWADNRIIPDMIRALREDAPVTIRNFDSVRPYQHVLDAVFAYVIIGMKQYEDETVSGNYNIGPSDGNVLTTRDLVNFIKERSALKVIDGSEGKTFKETNILKLNSDKLRGALKWAPVWDTKDETLSATYEWYKRDMEGLHPLKNTLQDIREFLSKAANE